VEVASAPVEKALQENPVVMQPRKDLTLTYHKGTVKVTGAGVSDDVVQTLFAVLRNMSN